MSAAQLQLDPQDASFAEADAPAAVSAGPHTTPSALKMQAAERLAAHRARRDHTASVDARLDTGLDTGLELAGPYASTPAPAPPAGTRATRIAAAVAERYAQSQTYRAFHAAEAERAIQQAQATAELAAQTALAIAAAEQQLLSDLESWTPADAPQTVPAHVEPAGPIATKPSPVLTVRLYEDVGRSENLRGTGIANAVLYEHLDEEQRLALDDEIAFRHAPVFHQFLEPAIPIPANLIEFPRQLVASRKARPRLAEGPLRDETDQDTRRAQLRIFEVAVDQISALPSMESTLPEWSSIRLSACSVTESFEAPASFASHATVFHAAPIGLRLMSAIVDGCIILAAFFAFATVAAYTAGQLPTGQIAALGAAGTLAALFLFYQLLFFTFSEATPGMRFARIGLCTFSDENPTRSAMRRRLVAILLAACPIGLGFLWACLDDDRLGWHDRISGMYQRRYESKAQG